MDIYPRSLFPQCPINASFTPSPLSGHSFLTHVMIALEIVIDFLRFKNISFQIDRGFFFLSSCFKIRFIIILIHNNNFFGVQMLISEKSICTETQESSNAVKLIIQMVIENENLWF